MNTKKIAQVIKFFRPVIKLPIHPQWFSSTPKKLINLIKNLPDNITLLDIGCADKWVKKHSPASCRYIGLDYLPTASTMYYSKPEIYANAEKLPFPNNSVDTILALDVLEHIQNPEVALREISRVLKPNGNVIIKIPFLYPIHDAPHDYTRFTEFGLSNILNKSNLHTEELIPIGEPLETAALISNISITLYCIRAIKKKSPLLAFSLLLPFIYIVNNSVAYILSRFSSGDSSTPHSYLTIVRKLD